MKAYKISCADEDHGAVIRFADRGKDLRGRSAAFCDCEYIDRKVIRAKEFDQYAPGPVTVQQYLIHGWFWECEQCYRLTFIDDAADFTDDSVLCRNCAEKSSGVK